ncbi:MAG: hypothetical protein H8E35_13555 [Ardenticatenia bacterium]|nr:hypothetical protein [Ardenticatenia bacterium]
MTKWLSILGAMVLLLPTFAVVSAAPPNPGSGESFISVQNLDPVDNVNIHAEYYNAATGIVDKTKDVWGVAPFATAGFAPRLIPDFPDNWMGSVVISADKEVAAVSSLVFTGGAIGGDGNTMGAYTSIPEGSTAVYLPSVGKRDREATWISVQNADVDPADVRIRFFDRDGVEIVAAVQDFTLQPGVQRTVKLFDIGGLPTNFLGAAYITSGKKVAAVATTHTGYDSDIVNGIVSGATKLYYPLIRRRQMGGGWHDYSGIVVQNFDTAASAEVHVYFYDRDGILKADFTDTIPALSSHGYNTRYVGNADPTEIDKLGLSYLGSAVVECTNGKLIGGIVKYENPRYALSAAYNAESAGRNNLFVPLACRRQFTPGVWYDSTGIIVQNLDAAASASVHVEFYDRATPPTKVAEFNDTIPANSSHGYNTRYYGNAPPSQIDGIPFDYVGSVRITSTNNKPLIGVVFTELQTDKGMYEYNGFVKDIP